MRPPAEWAMIAEAYEMSVAEIVRSIRTEVVVQSDYWLGQALDVQNAVRAHTAISQMIEKGNEDEPKKAGGQDVPPIHYEHG